MSRTFECNEPGCGTRATASSLEIPESWQRGPFGTVVCNKHHHIVKSHDDDTPVRHMETRPAGIFEAMDGERTPPSTPRRITERRMYDADDLRILMRGELFMRLQKFNLDGTSLSPQMIVGIVEQLDREDPPIEGSDTTRRTSLLLDYITRGFDRGRMAAETAERKKQKP